VLTKNPMSELDGCLWRLTAMMLTTIVGYIPSGVYFHYLIV